MQGMTEQRTARRTQLLRPEFRRAAPRQIFARDPLRHEAHAPRADMLVGAENVAHARVFRELPKQQIGLIDAAASRERPVRSDTFTGHSFSLDDAWVVMTARRDQPPQPG